MEIKRIPIKEFRAKGYLQELNRRFLHPLGLAVEVIVEADGSEKLGGIWDYREDEEGIYYALNNPELTDEKRINEFKNKHEFIQSELKKREPIRTEALGFFIEPIEPKNTE